MARQGYDPNIKAILDESETRAKMPGNEYNPNMLATRRWTPAVPWSRPTVSDTYDASVPFERRIIVSPLSVLGVIIACAVMGFAFLLFK